MIKLKKTEAFLICKNELVANIGLNDCNIYVLHTRTPMILAQVHHLDPGAEGRIKLVDLVGNITVGSMVEYPNENIALEGVIHQQADAEKLASVMRRMADWYYAYHKFMVAKYPDVVEGNSKSTIPFKFLK